MERILLVDDDENALAGYKRNLMLSFDVSTANGAMAGMKLIEDSGPFAVVVSDQKMPEVDGIKFLSMVKEYAPETVRIMLTGFAEMQTSIDAINEGNIFRFLTKPCPVEKLKKSIMDGVDQYKLIRAEKELLDQTLKGSIKVLVDILSMVSPQAFSRANRVQKLAKDIALKLGLNSVWEVEISTLLSQIGSIAIPQSILEKVNNNEPLTSEEETIYNSTPQVGKNLLEKIPRLDRIAEIISYQNKCNVETEFVSSKNKSAVPIESEILHVVFEYDILTSNEMDKVEAIKYLKNPATGLNQDVVAALDISLVDIYEGLGIKSISFSDLKAGAVLADDIKDKYGTVLITRGAEISEVSLARLIAYVKMRDLKLPIRIFDLS